MAAEREGFLVDPGVGIDQHEIEPKGFCESKEGVIQALNLISLPQQSGNAVALHGRWHQPDPAAGGLSLFWRYIVGTVLDRSRSLQMVIQCGLARLNRESKQNVDPWRGKIGIKDGNFLALHRESEGKICSQIRLSSTTTERVD